MNEIQPWKDVEPLKAEIEPPDLELPIPPDFESDSDSEPGLEPGPNDGHSAFSGARFADKRTCQRYRAVNGRGWLGWYEGSAFHQTAAWILDISAGGCLAAADRPAPTRGSAWLRLDNPAV